MREVTEFQFEMEKKKQQLTKATAHCHSGSGCIRRPSPITFLAVALGHCRKGNGRWSIQCHGRPLLKGRWAVAYAIGMVVVVSLHCSHVNYMITICYSI